MRQQRLQWQPHGQPALLVQGRLADRLLLLQVQVQMQQLMTATMKQPNC